MLVCAKSAYVRRYLLDVCVCGGGEGGAVQLHGRHQVIGARGWAAQSAASCDQSPVSYHMSWARAGRSAKRVRAASHRQTDRGRMQQLSTLCRRICVLLPSWDTNIVAAMLLWNRLTTTHCTSPRCTPRALWQCWITERQCSTSQPLPAAASPAQA